MSTNAESVRHNSREERHFADRHPTSQPRATRWTRWIRGAALLLIVVALLLLMRSLPAAQASAAMKGWISGLGIGGPIVLALIYIVATVLFVPGTILTLAAGAIFGIAVGTVTVSIGSTLGASVAFLIARYVARDKVAEMAHGNRHFGAIDRAIDEGGWRIVGLLRLSPAIPFNLQNYLYGLTPVRFWPCVLTSWLAMLPGTFLYVYIGHVPDAAVGGQRERSPMEWAMLAVGLTVFEGWHVHAQPSSADFLIATVVDVRPMSPGAPDVEVIETSYPKPKKPKVEGLGGGGSETSDVYSGTTAIKMASRIPSNAVPGTTHSRRVLANFQACSDTGTCLQPAEWSDEVSIRVNGGSELESGSRVRL
jgi:uncharacterized membrane protein YdjX (TVP38/TMEM64 family)